MRGHFIHHGTVRHGMSSRQYCLVLGRVVYHQFPGVHIKMQPLLPCFFWSITVVVCCGFFPSPRSAITSVIRTCTLFIFVVHAFYTLFNTRGYSLRSRESAILFAGTIKTSYCYACKFSFASRKITETKAEVNTHAQFFPRKKKIPQRPRSLCSELKSMLLFFVSEVGRWIESSTSLLQGSA